MFDWVYDTCHVTKNVERASDINTNCSRSSWNGQPGLRKNTGRNANQKMNWDHYNYSIKIG